VKIVMSQWGNDTKVYTDDGKDITAELGITNINIEVNLGEMTKVHLTCYVKGTEVHDYDMTHVIKTGLLPSMPGLIIRALSMITRWMLSSTAFPDRRAKLPRR
jgi:hypothetical protein